MKLESGIAALAALATLTGAFPRLAGVDRNLRLIKTSELDPGQWVTDEEKEVLVAARVGFFDITDITVRPITPCHVRRRRPPTSDYETRMMKSWK